jgi:anti-sigma factor RsiW
MTDQRTHVDDRIDDWIDGRLDTAERRELEEHLASCERCRALRDGLLAVREAVRRSAVAPPATDLAPALSGWLDAEDAAAGSAGPRTAGAPARRSAAVRLAAAAALAAAALAAALWFTGERGPSEDPVVAAFADFTALAAGALPGALVTRDGAEVEARWRSAELPFPVRLIDLSMMGIEVAGGDVSLLGGRRAARAVYRAPHGWIVCWMFEAAGAPRWAPSDERARHGGFEFEIHRRPGATLVLWREGAVVCLLVGGGDPQSILALARAKAMAPVAG